MVSGFQQVGILKSNTSDPKALVRIRTQPSVKADFVSKPAGTQVTVLPDTPVKKPNEDTGKIFTWYKVKHGPNANDIGWVREDVIELKDIPPTDPNKGGTKAKFKISAITDTYFKVAPEIQASDVKQGSDAVIKFPAKSSYNIAAYQESSNNHYYITFSDNVLAGKLNWYVFKPHVQITPIK